MLVINLKEVKKEGSPYVNWRIEYAEPYEVNGQTYQKVGNCQISASVMDNLIKKGVIKNAGELIGKNCFIGKSASGFFSKAEREYGFLNYDTVFILK